MERIEDLEKSNMKHNGCEHEHNNQTTQYRDAKIYTMLMVGELFMIARDTKDSETKERLEELLKKLNTPKIVRKFVGKIKVEEERSPKYIIEYDTRRGEHLFQHREILPTMYSVYDLMSSLGNFTNIHSGEPKHTENLRRDKMGNTYYPILATVNDEEFQFGITNFEIPKDCD